MQPKPQCDANRNFVSDLKFFLVKKFSVRNMDSNMQGEFKSNSMPNTPNLTEKHFDAACHINSIERYQKIIEDHKNILPKNFTIRQFPYSSCQDTFDPDCENKQEMLNENGPKLIPSKSPAQSIKPSENLPSYK